MRVGSCVTFSENKKGLEVPDLTQEIGVPVQALRKMTHPPSRPCGYFWTALIGSADGTMVEVTFPSIAG
jgi:hypothetical protein